MKRSLFLITLFGLGLAQMHEGQAMQRSKIPNVTKMFVKGGLTIAGMCATVLWLKSVHKSYVRDTTGSINTHGHWINIFQDNPNLENGYDLISDHERSINAEVKYLKNRAIISYLQGALVGGAVICWSGWSFIKDLRKYFQH